MANIYITKQRSVLRKTGDRLLVQKEDAVLLDVPCHTIDAVLIFGNVQFTTQAVHELFEHGIELAILTRHGRLVGQLTSPTTRNIDLRLAQFRRYDQPDFRLELARTITRAKIRNCLTLVQRFARNHREVDLEEPILALKRRMAACPGAGSPEELLGIEGIAARDYFGAFASMVRADFNFPGRKKRPPPDPVNALLSFSYTLLFNEISSLLDGLGFDPYLGYLHHPDYGRPSLACDLIEEFRAPVADRLTLRLLNNRILTREHFHGHATGRGAYLTREGMQRYFREYESFMSRPVGKPAGKTAGSFRRCIRSQAEKLARTIRDSEPYTPFLL